MTIEGLAGLLPLVGKEVGISNWLTMTQERIDQFAAASGDQQWIHTDPERAARETPYGSTIAHGFLTLSLLSQFASDAIDLRGDFRHRLNYGLNRVRFCSPVKTGSRIRGRFKLAALGEVAGGFQITYEATVEIENNAKPALVAEWLVRVLTA